MMRTIQFILIYIITIIAQNSISNAQPYKYFFSGDWRNRSISRIDIETGIAEEFVSDCGIGLQLFTTPDQEIIIYTNRAMVYALNVNDSNNKVHLMEKSRDEEIIEILDAPKTQKIYLMWGDVDHNPEMTLVIDRTTFTIKDTLYNICSYFVPFLSENETNILKLIPDKDGIFFKILTSSGDVINEKIECGNLGSFNFVTGIRDGKAGKGLIVFSYEKGHEHKYYTVCDPINASNDVPIHFPWRSKAYLSSDAKHVIIEEVQFIKDNNQNTSCEYRPGNIYIFNSETGIILKRLKLQPEGQLIITSASNENFYYYLPESPEETIPINLSEGQLHNEFLDIIDNDLDDLFNNNDIFDQTVLTRYKDYIVEIKSEFEQNNIVNARTIIETFLNDLETDNGISISHSAYLLISYNIKLLSEKVSLEQPSLIIKLVNSQHQLIPDGQLKYYEGGWKDATDHGDGTFSIDTEQSTVKLRMNYAYASQDMDNVPVNGDTAIFQTVLTNVELRNSQNQLIDEGTIKYYAGGWRDFGTTTNGLSTKELLPNNYKFRMTYAFASNDQKQDISINPTVTFQTVNTQVELRNSNNELMDEGTVKYYAGGWRDFGTTSNGIASKELLPNNHKFRISYAFASTDQEQDISTNPIITFQTLSTQVELRNSNNELIDEATVKYYSGGWRDFGVTSNGTVSKELLANTYKFRLTYSFASNDQEQDISGNSIITFQTLNTQVELRNSNNELIDEGTVKYYSGSWRDFGVTSNGIASKELLPNNHKFRMSYAFASNEQEQDISANPIITFQTLNTQVELRNSNNELIDEGTVKYYSGSWRDFGVTSNGIASKELLPNNHKFRMSYAFASNDQEQDISANPTVTFQTLNTQVELRNSNNVLIDDGSIKYYSGGWREFGVTSNGIASKELLPNNHKFRMTYAFASNDKEQDISANSTVLFQTMKTQVELRNSNNELIDEGNVKYYSGGWRDFGMTSNGVANKELLPNNYNFRMSYAFASDDKSQDINDNRTITFQTTNTQVELRDSNGDLIDEGTVKYYSGGWRDFGVTTNGIVTKELLPKSYQFRMNYEYGSNDITQSVDTNPLVQFSTVAAIIRVNDLQSQPVDGALAKYYSGGWRNIGETVNGEVIKELLPNSYQFRINYESVQEDKTQDLGVDNVVEFAIDTSQ